MRVGRVPINVIKGTMDAVGKAGRFLDGLAAAGRAAVNEVRKNPEKKEAERKESNKAEPPVEDRGTQE
jgi:hypothetical protein